MCQDLQEYRNIKDSLLSRLGLATKTSPSFVVQIATLGLSWEKAIDYSTVRKLESALPCFISSISKEVGSNVCAVSAMFTEPHFKGIYIHYLSLGTYL